MLGSARTTSSYLEGLNYFINNSAINNIPRQSVYNWIKGWDIPDIKPEVLPAPKTLYVMTDEKYIGSQDTVNDIMVKCFVTFEGIQQVSKGTKELINRRIFSCNEKNAWTKFMDYIAYIYAFTKIDNIVLLGDGANWIKAGIFELKLAPNNNVSFRLCEVHFKQAINRITTDKDERKSLTTTVINKSKKEFENEIANINGMDHRLINRLFQLKVTLNNLDNITELPQSIGIDEFKGNMKYIKDGKKYRYKYQIQITDLDTSKVIALLPVKENKCLENFLKKIKNKLDKVFEYTEELKTAYSNGKTEGNNNTIKVLKRVSYGFGNFENAKNRILVYCQ